MCETAVLCINLSVLSLMCLEYGKELFLNVCQTGNITRVVHVGECINDYSSLSWKAKHFQRQRNNFSFPRVPILAKPLSTLCEQCSLWFPKYRLKTQAERLGAWESMHRSVSPFWIKPENARMWNFGPLFWLEVEKWLCWLVLNILKSLVRKYLSKSWLLACHWLTCSLAIHFPKGNF